MNRSTHLKFEQLKVIIISWVLISFLFAVYDHLAINTADSLGPSAAYSFGLSVLISLCAGLFAAVTAGSFLIFYVNVKYRDKPYGHTILAVTLFYILITLFISFLLGLILVPMKTGLPITDPVSRSYLWDFYKDPSHIKYAISWAAIVSLTQFLLQMNSKFGQADFLNIISGKYYTPIQEKRIFMFLDIDSSTSITEDLGDRKYHAFLKDFFDDITDPVLNNRGSIYQYVGDEVVVVWKYADGKENLHCLRCFFDIKKEIQKKKAKYMRRYGVYPSFKAGIHCGKVIAGEVGIIKRDITYSGNVLNTTSRIISKCSELGEEVIVSAELLKVLNISGNYITRPLGPIKLEGKEKEEFLHALNPVTVSPAAV